MIGALADALTAPQFPADFGVGVAHSSDRQEICHDHESHVVSIKELLIFYPTVMC